MVDPHDMDSPETQGPDAAPEVMAPAPLDDMPEPRLKRRRHFSIVWLIPLVAALVAAWMAWQAVQSQGPLVTIRFDTAEGLQAGKTKIKYRNVEVGKVEQIEFASTLDEVIVTARMAKSMEPYLRTTTQFWVVRARVSMSEVSGLGTLFSGAYIGVQPADPADGIPRHDFLGLADPPPVTDPTKGRHFVVRAESLGSLDLGSPVYYHQIRVGKVVSHQLLDDGDVDIRLFVDAPHHERICTDTRFWNASGLDIAMDATGVHVNTGSLVSMLIGGISFDDPPGGTCGARAEEDHVFPLYSDRSQSYERSYEHKEIYLLHFDGSVRGLSIGAPVEYRGMTVGHVTDLKLQYDPAKGRARIPVLIEIEPERFEIVGQAKEPGDIMAALVAKGLRAQLKTGSLITGQSFVDLDFHPGLPKADIAMEGLRPVLPTVPSPLDSLMASFGRVLNKIDDLPLKEVSADMMVTMGDLRKTMDELQAALEDSRALMRNVDRNVVPRAGDVLDKIQGTLDGIDDTLDPNSVMHADLQRLLKELADAARSLRVLADYLERQPDALLYGKGN